MKKELPDADQRLDSASAVEYWLRTKYFHSPFFDPLLLLRILMDLAFDPALEVYGEVDFNFMKGAL